MTKKMITTIDNPYDPFTEWDKWYSFDTDKGYNTCSYMSRLNDEFGAGDITLDEDEYEEDAFGFDVVDAIAKMNINGMYKVVTMDSQETQ
jgi:hypothetical protein